MYPEYATVPPANNRNRQFLAGVVLVVAIVATLGLWVAQHKSTPTQTTGKLNIMYNPSDARGIVVSLNGKPATTLTVPLSYTLAPGSYALVITTPGYKDFSATVPVERGKTVLVNAQLIPSTKLTIDSPSDISLPADVGNASIVDSQYFLNNSWAILHVNTATDSNAVLVLQRNQSAGWRTVLGPAHGFDPNEIDSLPSVIQQYLTYNGNVINGD